MSGATSPEAETIIRQTETINRLMGQSASQIERVQRQLDSAYAAQQRYQQAQNAIVSATERGRITQERANELLQLAQQRYQQAGQAASTFASANDNAARSSRGFGGIIGQAGFQIQDFAVQIQSGTSALTALSQQGSQLLGAFGTGGAIAGAVLTVGLLAVQLFTGGDAAKAFNDALDRTRTLYDALNDAAARRAEGQEAEITRTLRLRDYYASLNEEQRRGIEATANAALRAQDTQAQRLLDSATSRIRPLLASGQDNEFGLARTRDDLLGVEAALQGIDLQSGRSQEQLLGLIGSLDSLARSSSQYAPAAAVARDAAIGLLDQFGRLDAAARAAGRGIDEVAVAQRQLQQQVAASNVGANLAEQLAQAEAVARRYSGGDVAGARNLVRLREQDARAQALAQQAMDEARRSFPEGTDRGVIDQAVAARRTQIEQDASRLAETERRNRDAEEAARQAEREADRNARRGAAEARREERRDERFAERARRERDAFTASVDPAERYRQRLEGIADLNDRLARAGESPLPDEAIIRASKQALEEYNRALKGASDTTDAAREAAKRFEMAADAFGKELAGAFEDLVFEGKAFDDVLKNLERSLLRLGNQYLLAPLFQQGVGALFGTPAGGAGGGSGGGLGGLIGQGVGALFGSGGGGGGLGAGQFGPPAPSGGGIGAVIGQGFSALASLFHEGGIAGGAAPTRLVPASVFLDAPRYHAGAVAGGMTFANDEVPAILRRGEMVLTERQQQAVASRGSINQTIIVKAEDPGAFNRTRGQMARDMQRDLARASRST
jgi:hypothetical protein